MFGKRVPPDPRLHTAAPSAGTSMMLRVFDARGRARPIERIAEQIFPNLKRMMPRRGMKNPVRDNQSHGLARDGSVLRARRLPHAAAPPAPPLICASVSKITS